MNFFLRVGLTGLLLVVTVVAIACGDGGGTLAPPAGSASDLNTFLYVYSDN